LLLLENETTINKAKIEMTELCQIIKGKVKKYYSLNLTKNKNLVFD